MVRRRTAREVERLRYKLLGRSGLRVSELALGTMTFGTDWGWGADKDECSRVFDAFVDAGGNLIDTANRYTFGTSERFVGEFIRGDRDRFVLATKFTITNQEGDPNASGNQRKNLMRSVRESMERLGTDYIDLLWVHMWDPLTPIEELMRGLDDMVRSGRVHYVGISDAPAWVVSRANTMADHMGWTPFTALQIRYSLIDRTPERDLMPMARALDLAVTPWAVLGAGLLTGKYTRGELTGEERLKVEPWRAESVLTERNMAIAKEVDALAEEMGATPSQVALGWMRQRPGVVIPIVGARTRAHLEDNLGCLDVELTPEQVDRLDEASAFELGFPHDFLASDLVRNLMYGGLRDRTDHHRSHWEPR